MTTISPWTRPKTLMHLLLILVLIFLNWLVFQRFLHQNYFLWYLKNGVVISLATPFLALIWKDMKVRIGLISSHPSAYVAACFQLLGVFVYSLAPLDSDKRAEPRDVGFDIGLYSGLAEALDSFLYYVVAIVMLVLGLAWGVLVAPLLYFVTLIAGVPARQELRGKIVPTYVHEETSDEKPEDKGKIQLLEPGEAASRTDASYLSFARDPFAVTQAMTTVVLWLANNIYSRVS